MRTLNSTAKWLGTVAAAASVLLFLDFLNVTIFSKEKQKCSIHAITTHF